jgi:hypothetical protein
VQVSSQPDATNRNTAINLYSGTGTTVVGAYYDELPDVDDAFAQVYNSTPNTTLEYTHCAIFIDDSGTINPLKRPETVDLSTNTTLNANLNYFEDRFIGTVPYNAGSFSVVRFLNSGQFINTYFYLKTQPPGGPFALKNFGPTFTSSTTFDALIDTYILERSNLFNNDYPVVGGLTNTNLPFNAVSKIHQTVYKKLFSLPGTLLNDSNPSHNLLVELLNVTTSAPADDSPWSDWEEHRIKRYYISSVSGPYGYTPRELVFVEIISDYYYGTITITETYTGVEITTKDPWDLTITPPSSGSFTFTHVAVFSTDRTTPLPSGTTYVYPDEDKLLGVIDMEESVTVSSTDELNYVVPLKVSYVLGPKRTREVVFS